MTTMISPTIHVSTPGHAMELFGNPLFVITAVDPLLGCRARPFHFIVVLISGIRKENCCGPLEVAAVLMLRECTGDAHGACLLQWSFSGTILEAESWSFCLLVERSSGTGATPTFVLLPFFLIHIVYRCMTLKMYLHVYKYEKFIIVL